MSVEVAAPPSKAKKPKSSSSLSKKRKHIDESESAIEESASSAVAAAAVEDENERPRKAVNDELEPEPDAVSHAELRKRRKLEKKRKAAGGDDEADEQAGGADASASNATGATTTAANAAAKEKRSGHGVWVGNLSFKTDAEKIKAFFAPCGSITRLHMPKGTDKFAQNRGFAYVDFEDPVGVTTAISMSEQNLDGRRLLIKDAKSYEGRPKSVASEAVIAAGADAGKDKGMSKTARKILDRQKNPPAPTLFVGNLGFETTVDMIKEAVEAHYQASRAWEKKTKKDRKRAAKGKGKAIEAEDGDAASSDGETSDEEGVEENAKAEEGNTADAGIRKIRLGTFEDSGKCKGWAFIDFHTSAQATAALINGRNHTLNGRALKLEYASADAVRRGGGRMDGLASVSAPARDRSQKRPYGKRDAADGQDDGEAEGEGEEEAEPVKQAFYRPPLETNPYTASEASRANAAIIQAGGKVHKPNKAERKALRDQKAQEDRSNSKRRVKPGAALADAKREKMAILPAAGKKVVFD